MDVRELCSGATLYLPVLNRGALFSAGDAHAAQGDGEVCINGIECPADVTLRFHVHKQRALAGPLVESAARDASETRTTAWIVVESATDAIAAAARGHFAHDRFVGGALGLQRRSRVPAVQRRHASAVEPGGERTDVHGQRGHREAGPAAEKTFLTCERP